MYRRGGLRVANASSKWAPVQPGISCRMRSLLLHGKSSPLEMVPQPHRTQERGEMTGKGSGQAELLVTPADTNQRGTVGSVVHLRTSPENGTISQEGPADPTHQDPTLRKCPSVQDPAQQQLAHKRGATHHCKAKI